MRKATKCELLGRWIKHPLEQWRFYKLISDLPVKRAFIDISQAPWKN